MTSQGVKRGGGYGSPARNVRASERGHGLRGGAAVDLGFRCADDP